MSRSTSPERDQISSLPVARGRVLLTASRQFSDGEDDDADDEDASSERGDTGSDSRGDVSKDEGTARVTKPPKIRTIFGQPSIETFLVRGKDAGDDDSEMRPEPSPSRSRAGSATNDEEIDTPSATPSPKKRKRKQAKLSVERTRAPSLDEMEVSIDSVRQVLIQRGLDPSLLTSWQLRPDGRFVDAQQQVHKSVRDAVRAVVFTQLGSIPREDIYFLAILRRQLAEKSLPFQDGPIRVLALGTVLPKALFSSQKKLFPVGYETITSVQLASPCSVKIQLNCKIIDGSNQKSPVFVVSAVRDPEVVFRSYVGSKAWRKAIRHLEELSTEEIGALADDGDDEQEHLSSSSSEDGFGLLRRNIARLLEGDRQVMACPEYQFWEERHPVSLDAHTKLRSRLVKQVKEQLKHDDLSKDAINQMLSQDELIENHSKTPEQLQKDQARLQREVEKQSVREAARKLLEIELKVQEDAKEAQRREREERRNALLEAKLEQVRQKDAKKEAQRREKEEERRMREEEREMRKFLKEEEKKRKVEEKETLMQRKVDELRERKKLREQQRANGEPPHLSPVKRGAKELSAEQQRSTLLRFVRDERDRRRRLRLWERRRMSEKTVWSSVKSDFCRFESCMVDEEESEIVDIGRASRPPFPTTHLSNLPALDLVPRELLEDVVFVWDILSSFSDVLLLPVVPEIETFVQLLVTSSNPSSDKKSEDATRSLASLQIDLVKALLTEYFPVLQMGTTLDEFLRSRPLNLYTWPEIARQVCLLAVESAHPTIDDSVVKALKGTRATRDDPALQPLRQRLEDRGVKLLAGEQYNEAEDAPLTAQPISQPEPALALTSAYYGVVIDDGIDSLVRVEEREGFFVVAALRSEKKIVGDGVKDGALDSDTSVHKINEGDFLVAFNGYQLANVTGIASFQELVESTPAPHGLLLSSAQPSTKMQLKQAPTTHRVNRLKRCAHVLKILRSKEIAVPFNQPVDAEMYPDYYSSITEPMDLGTIQEKLEDDEYENEDDVENFVDDVNTVWKNCYSYNSVKAEISHMAKKLSAIFDRLMEEWVDTDVVKPLNSSEEDHCRSCRTNFIKDRLLLCDRCDASYHTFCLRPPLKKVPSGEWYCPRCTADPSFAPNSSKKKQDDNGSVTESGETIQYSEVELKLLQVLEYLSKDDWSQLSLAERVATLRGASDLLLMTSAVQNLYRSLEEKASELRRDVGGDSLADLLRAWSHFDPPRVASGIDRTSHHVVDGVDCELSDQLLEYLEAKAMAERDNLPLPPPPRGLPSGHELAPLEDEGAGSERQEDVSESENDEDQLIEELGDLYGARGGDVGGDQCHFCGLEDGVLHGALQLCTQSPLTHIVSPIGEFELPPILLPNDTDEEDEQSVRPVLTAQFLSPSEIATLQLTQAPGGFRYVVPGSDHATNDTETSIYSVNDRLVHGMSREELTHALQVAKQPVCVYSALASSHDALHASVSIVCLATRGALGLELSGAHDGFIFIQSVDGVGIAALSQQVFPGDVLWMVNGVGTFGRDASAVYEMLQSLEDPITLVLVRSPSKRMKEVALFKSGNAALLAAQRIKLSELVTSVVAKAQPREFYDVTFQYGPLGLALSLEERVIVKSLNDNADGSLGQASLSGKIRAGDVIERVNGKDYGPLRDLSQFTGSLVTLPRPVIITFSRAKSELNESSTGCLSPADSRTMSRRLGLKPRSELVVKTVVVSPENLVALQSIIDDFGIGKPTVITHSQFPIDGTDGTATLKLGDVLAGVNGCSTAGLPWSAIFRVIAQVRGPAELQFVERQSLPTAVRAHAICTHQANVAWSELEALQPKIEKARQVERFIRHVVPRTSCLGTSSDGYSFFEFHGDRRRVLVKVANGNWRAIERRGPEMTQLIKFLDESGDRRDRTIAIRLRSSLETSANLGSILASGPFAISSGIDHVHSEGSEGDKYQAFISYLGRKYLVGSFSTRQEADVSLKRAEASVRSDGVHSLPSKIPVQPAMEPTLKSETFVRRSIQRRYEHGAFLDASGQQRRVLLSQTVVRSLFRGVVAQANVYSDSYKRKAPEPLNSGGMYARVDLSKRMRPLSAQSAPSLDNAKPGSHHLADQGRAMLMAWNNFTRAPTPQMTQALAYACLACFEEVKKTCTRILTDSSAALPTAVGFVSLHHAYIIGLICAMVAQALTNSRLTPGDVFVSKAFVDAFVSSILCCIEPSPQLRARAISGFATAAKVCDRTTRPRDVTDALGNVADFIVQFVQVSRYLATGSFDDLSQCRSVIGPDQRAMEMLPVSFVQQARLLENVRRAYITRASAVRASSGGAAMARPTSTPGAVSGTDQLSHVDFGPGPLGIMINYSARGKVVVTEYSSEGGRAGQAQASGKVVIGDEVYAVNGRLVDSIGGMEGFKMMVASGPRPIRVTFKRSMDAFSASTRASPVTVHTMYQQSVQQAAQQPIQPIPLNVMPQPMRNVYQQEPTPVQSMPIQSYGQHAMPGSTGFVDMMPASSYGNANAGSGQMSTGAMNWQHQQPQYTSQSTLPSMSSASLNPLRTPPQYPRSSASMGFPSPPDLSSMGSQPQSMPMMPMGPASMSQSYPGSFVAGNDTSFPVTDEGNISYYDANGTTFRSTPDFEIDTTATSADDVSSAQEEQEATSSILEMDTEEEDHGDEESAANNSGSISQMTTPANSDVEDDGEDKQPAGVHANGLHIPTQPLTSDADPKQDDGVDVQQVPLRSPTESADDDSVIDVSEDMSLSMARRSARVPRKITSNIGDLYNPELIATGRGRTSTSGGDSGLPLEPTHGEVGELATELLEPFSSTIRQSQDVPPLMKLLRSQLLMIEAAIPRDAFRAGRWSKTIRAAWAELVFSSDRPALLMEGILFLESVLETEWLEPWWKSSNVPSARYALSNATAASAAMRLYALDDAITYIRVKQRGGRRKQQNRSGPQSSNNSSPVKPSTIDLTSSAMTAAVTHPAELPFMDKLQPGTIDVANRIVANVLSMQREKTLSAFAQRKAMRELMALTDLTEDQVEQWIRAASHQSLSARSQQQQQQQAADRSPGSTRQPTPKRKLGAATGGPSSVSSSDQRPTRKRKVVYAEAEPSASLRCFTMRDSSTPYAIPSASDPTLKPRVDHLLATLLKHELALPFAAPVNPRDVPGYLDVIETPMDLGTVKARLLRGYYDGRMELVAKDVNQIWANCFTFNQLDADISVYANRLRSIFNRLFEHWISDQRPGTPVASLPSEEACRHCSQTHASDQMLLCDSCDAAYHVFCLSPPLAAIPEGDWFCPRCPLHRVTIHDVLK